LKAGKAPGKDGIDPEFLRNLGPKTHHWIAEVFHAIYKSGRVPKSWKTANVIELLKPGKPADNPTSFRPILLLSVLSKLMEKNIPTHRASNSTVSSLLSTKSRLLQPSTIFNITLRKRFQ